jgi:hypothetical protein
MKLPIGLVLGIGTVAAAGVGVAVYEIVKKPAAAATPPKAATTTAPPPKIITATRPTSFGSPSVLVETTTSITIDSFIDQTLVLNLSSAFDRWIYVVAGVAPTSTTIDNGVLLFEVDLGKDLASPVGLQASQLNGTNVIVVGWTDQDLKSQTMEIHYPKIIVL